MAKQVITTVWQELIGVSEINTDKYIENRTNESIILIYFGATPPLDDEDASTLRFPESAIIPKELNVGKVWVKSINNGNATVNIQ